MYKIFLDVIALQRQCGNIYTFPNHDNYILYPIKMKILDHVICVLPPIFQSAVLHNYDVPKAERPVWKNI